MRVRESTREIGMMMSEKAKAMRDIPMRMCTEAISTRARPMERAHTPGPMGNLSMWETGSRAKSMAKVDGNLVKETLT